MAFSFWKKMFGGEEGEGAAVEVPVDDVASASAAPVAVMPEAASEDPASSEDVTVDEVVLASEDESESLVPADIAGLEEFVSYVARNLVDNPEAVSISTVEKERISVIQIRCEKKDIGKIIGKNGKTIAAIRLLVSGAGGRMGLRLTVDVLD